MNAQETAELILEAQAACDPAAFVEETGMDLKGFMEVAETLGGSRGAREKPTEFTQATLEVGYRLARIVDERKAAEGWRPRCERCQKEFRMVELRYRHCIGCLAVPGVLEKARSAVPMEGGEGA